MLRFLSISTVVAGVLSLLVGCSTDPVSTKKGEEGSLTVSLVAPAGSAFSDIAKTARARVTAQDMDTVWQSLTVTTTTVSGTISGIMAGDSRKFEIFVYDSLNVVCYYGAAISPVIGGTNVTVPIALYRRTPGGAIIQGQIIDSTYQNVAPWVMIVSPTDGNDFRPIDTILVTASASDSDGVVQSVAFYLDTVLVAVDSAAPYQAMLSNLSLGNHHLTAIATDNLNETGYSAAVSIIVSNTPHQYPIVTITSPATGSVFRTGDSVVVNVSAIDSIGRVQRVLLYRDSSVIGIDSIAPYRFYLYGVRQGTYTLTAQAFSSTGEVGISGNVSYSVGIDNNPPTVRVVSPLNGSSYRTTDSISFNATASDSDGTVRYVSFFVDSTMIDIDSIAPYQITLNRLTAGTHHLFAEATDNMNETSRSQSNAITITAVNRAPIVSVVSPLNGSSYRSTDSISFTATASDSDGTVRYVRFYVDSKIVFIDSVAPYQTILYRLGAGTRALSAEATDNMNATSRSQTNTITVTSVNRAPVIAVVSPANGSSYRTTDSISFTATASDSDGTVRHVRFYVDSTIIGSDSVAPYRITLNRLTVGTHRLFAEATDNSNATTRSQTNTITITSTPVTYTIDDNDSSIQYSGFSLGNRNGCYNGGYHSSSTTNAFYQISFVGTQLQLYAAKNNYTGIADIYVNNVFRTSVDLYSATPMEQQLYYNTGVLSYGSHTVRVVVKGTRNPASNGVWVECDRTVITR
jgi:hypothetical protein